MYLDVCKGYYVYFVKINITYFGYLEVSPPYPPVTFCFCPVRHGDRLKCRLSKKNCGNTQHQTFKRQSTLFCLEHYYNMERC